MLNILEQLLKIICILGPLLVILAYFTLLERKVMASLQRRYGPNVVGLWGLLQPIADGLKLLSKEIVVPARSNFFLFLFAPILTMSLSFTLWSIIPLNYGVSYFDSNYGLLLLLTLSSLNVYSLVIAGWSSNSKYALLGAIRAIAQLLSYELVLGIVILCVVSYTGTLNLVGLVYYQQFIGSWLVFPLLPIAGITFVTFLAETNRTPFDLPEAEAELVAGYNIEYSSIPFALFFLGEYCNIVTMSALWVILFFGGWSLPGFNFLYPTLIMALKTIVTCIMFIVVRALLPRYRFDQLMIIGWKIFIPVTFSYLIFLVGVIKVFDLPLVNTLSYYYPINCYHPTVVRQNRSIDAYKLLDMRDTLSGLLRFHRQYCLDNSKEVSALITKMQQAGALTRGGAKPFFLLREYDIYYKTDHLFSK